ncbi:MAG: CvpA family protein [Porticoccaceae bacterium]|jgi:membrane protein required for colicin V production|nr:CvpA family protein [Porticoccaceae bacterium]MBT5578186.1 CvpA family protein [Porticoccaceae bacterium]MBT7375729.1 CvpA family protein [Porticoccaceae bacterium]
MDFATADLVILAIVAISGLISLVRGFVKEAMSLVIWIAAFIVAMNFKEPVSEMLVNFIELASFRQLAAWGGLFVGTLLLGAVVNFLLGKLVSSTGLSGTDRTLGLVFGVFRGLLIVLALVVILPKAVPVDQDPWWNASALIPLFQGFETWGREAAAGVKDFLTSWM